MSVHDVSMPAVVVAVDVGKNTMALSVTDAQWRWLLGPLDFAMAGSIGTVGDALDNALCESTIGLLKTEAINDGGPTWPDRRAVEWQVARWVHWYNHQRLHSSIGDLPPLEFEDAYRQAQPVTLIPDVA